MNVKLYDFESLLEQGFKTLFDTAQIELRIADDVDEGELHDERVTLELDVGGVISGEHIKADERVYNNYAGTIDVKVETPRVPNDQVPTDPNFKSRQAQLVATARKTLEEITEALIATHWPDGVAPTKITPTGTQRDNDAKSRMTVISYEVQFRIA